VVKQNSGVALTVGEGQATMGVVGIRGDLRPSAMRTQTSNTCPGWLISLPIKWISVNQNALS